MTSISDFFSYWMIFGGWKIAFQCNQSHQIELRLLIWADGLEELWFKGLRTTFVLTDSVLGLGLFQTFFTTSQHRPTTLLLYTLLNLASLGCWMGGKLNSNENPVLSLDFGGLRACQCHHEMQFTRTHVSDSMVG